MRALGDRTRHDYLPNDGPFVLREYLRSAGMDRLEGPTVARCRGPGGVLWGRRRTGAGLARGREAATPEPTQLSPFLRKEAPDEVVWFLPHRHGFELRVRPLGDAGAPEHPMPIPDRGPWALPAPWEEPPLPEVAYAELKGACPHCQVTADRYRRLSTEDGLVCAACGRSFRAHDLWVDRRTE